MCSWVPVGPGVVVVVVVDTVDRSSSDGCCICGVKLSTTTTNINRNATNQMREYSMMDFLL